jgi:hypothetical protein
MSQTKSHAQRKKFIVYLLALIFLALGSGLCYWQYNKMNDQIAQLKRSQLPTRKFSSYEDCINNGGVDLWTINVQFSGCLGGEEFPEYSRDEGYVYQAQAFMQYSAQNLPRLIDKPAIEGDPHSLADFLKTDDADCETKLVKEVPGRFALTNYLCAHDAVDDKNYRIAIKLGDGWRYISTTNAMNEDGVPSCLVVDMFKVSKRLTSKCYENTGYNNGFLKTVVHP